MLRPCARMALSDVCKSSQLANAQIITLTDFYHHDLSQLGKHYPASHRGKHSTRTDKVVPVTNSLPLVAIRDPWMWLQSMCRHHYTALWPHGDAHCPNLVATDNEIENFPRLKQLYYKTNIEGLGEKIDEPLIPVTVKYDKDVYNHGSLAHFWSEWYRLYLDADFPRIMVRFEDMLFHAKEVIERECIENLIGR